MSVRLVTVHPFDPWGSKIGGIESIVRSTLKYAPDDFLLEMVGVAEDENDWQFHHWNRRRFEGREIAFYPLFTEPRPNERKTVPLFLRFPWALRRAGLDFSDAIVIYHRIEPLAFANIPSETNILCIHGDPREITGARSEVKWKYIPWLYRMAEARAIRRARHVFCVERRGLDYLEKRYSAPDRTFSFLPTWYRSDIYHPGNRQDNSVKRSEFIHRLGLMESSPRFVLFAGRWEQQKNPLLAIDTFALVANEHANCHLLLVGAGSLTEAMERRVLELELTSRIHFLGTMEPIRLADAMRCSDVMLVTSEFEGMPVLILEAQACGLPVVTTDSGEAGSIVRDGVTGRILPVHDAEPLARAVLDTLSTPGLYYGKVCTDAVKPYRPEAILPAFFETLKQDQEIRYL